MYEIIIPEISFEDVSSIRVDPELAWGGQPPGERLELRLVYGDPERLDACG